MKVTAKDTNSRKRWSPGPVLYSYANRAGQKFGPCTYCLGRVIARLGVKFSAFFNSFIAYMEGFETLHSRVLDLKAKKGIVFVFSSCAGVESGFFCSKRLTWVFTTALQAVVESKENTVALSIVVGFIFQKPLEKAVWKKTHTPFKAETFHWGLVKHDH